jgi:hypothetical protein
VSPAFLPLRQASLMTAAAAAGTTMPAASGHIWDAYTSNGNPLPRDRQHPGRQFRFRGRIEGWQEPPCCRPGSQEEPGYRLPLGDSGQGIKLVASARSRVRAARGRAPGKSSAGHAAAPAALDRTLEEDPPADWQHISGHQGPGFQRLPKPGPLLTSASPRRPAISRARNASDFDSERGATG